MKGAKPHKPKQQNRTPIARRLEVATIGRVSLQVSGTPLRLPSRKANALIGYLAVSEAIEETRERLVGLLWSETHEENARASLRQILHEIRGGFQALGFDGLRAEKRVVALDQDRISVDIHEVLEAARLGRAHPRLAEVARLPDTLLAGFEDVDPAFRIWLLAKRQALHDRVIRGLEGGLRACADDEAEREKIAQAIMTLDPTHEEACRVLIRLRARRGDFGGAMRFYKSLWDVLEQEFDVEPSAETQALIVDVRNAAATAAPSPGTAGVIERPAPMPSPTRPSAERDLVLTIGAFDASATREDQRYVVSGFRHELVASLVRFREWRVRDDPRTGSPIGSGSEYRVEASAITTPEDIRLILTLREVETSTYVWSDHYHITLANWFEAQQSIVRRIAVGLNIHLSASRLSRLSGDGGIAPHVYDRWLRAQEMILKFSPREWARAADIFRATITDTPNFSPAYSSLVQINNTTHFVHPGIFRTRERERETLELARAAVQLDPVDSRAQLSMGWAHAMAGNYANAEIHMGLAIELNENDSWTVISAALFNAFSGRFETARELVAHAGRLAPAPTATQWVYASTAYFLCGDYADCIVASRRSSDAIWSNVAWRAAALCHLGDHEEAVRDMRRFLDGLRPQWQGPRPAGEADMIRWLLHLYPIRSPADWERLRHGLAGAGAPVEGTSHGIW